MMRRRRSILHIPLTILGLTAPFLASIPVRGSTPYDAEPTLVRLSVWMPPDRVPEFAAAFDTLFNAPDVSTDLVPSSRQSRTNVDSVFTRLYEFRTGPRGLVDNYSKLKDRARNSMPDAVRERYGITDIHLTAYSYPASSAALPPAPVGQGKGQWRTFDASDGLPALRVYGMHEDRDGAMWFGTESGAAVLRDDGTFAAIPADAGCPEGLVWSIAHGADGAAWLGIGSSVVRYDGHTCTSFTPPDAGYRHTVWDLHVDRQGRVWAGTYGAGVVCVDGDSVRTFTTRDGLAHDVVSSIAQDSRDHLWFGTEGGLISRFDGHVWQTLSIDDGLTGQQIQALAAAPDSSMWIGSVAGLQQFQSPSAVPPVVRIEAVGADSRYLAPTDVHFPSTVGAVAVELSSQSLKTLPGAMVYRYRLLGHEDQWRNTREQRIEYRGLPSGDYTFEVVAVDRDLVYSQPATVRLRVHPPYERFAWIAALSVEFRRQFSDVPSIRTDPEILRKVLMNLLGNAVKFTEKGSLTLSVQSVDGAVELSVADTGVGIPPEDLPYIFEEFRQVERQGSPEKEGTGLGLAIAKKSVELLGGTITAASEVGKGTTFTMRIENYETKAG